MSDDPRRASAGLRMPRSAPGRVSANRSTINWLWPHYPGKPIGGSWSIFGPGVHLTVFVPWHRGHPRVTRPDPASADVTTVTTRFLPGFG